MITQVGKIKDEKRNLVDESFSRMAGSIVARIARKGSSVDVRISLSKAFRLRYSFKSLILVFVGVAVVVVVVVVVVGASVMNSSYS